MQEKKRFSVVRCREGAVSCEEIQDSGEEAGMEGAANVSNVRRRSDDDVGGMSRANRVGQVLSAQEGERFTDGQESCLPMKVFPRDYLQGADGNPESTVLDDLQGVHGRVRGISEPDWCRIGKDRLDECLVGEYQVLLGWLQLVPARVLRTFNRDLVTFPNLQHWPQ